jgi:hypothetical protein
MINDALFAINQIRDIWKSYLPVAITDCGKFDEVNIQKLKAVNAFFVNICSKPVVFGMSKRAQKKLKSWYCKPAVSLFQRSWHRGCWMDYDACCKSITNLCQLYAVFSSVTV